MPVELKDLREAKDKEKEAKEAYIASKTAYVEASRERANLQQEIESMLKEDQPVRFHDAEHSDGSPVRFYDVKFGCGTAFGMNAEHFRDQFVNGFRSKLDIRQDL